MSNISYQVTGVVTLPGISAAIQAGITGPQINVAGFRIGSLSAAEGAVALETDVDVDGYVYSGDTSSMTYSQIDTDTIIWRIRLDPSIGNFDVGNIGIILDGGTLFCKAVLPGQSAKYKSNPPQVVGNTRFYNIVMHMANAAGLINLSVLESTSASLPEVATENDLPAPNSTPFNAYLVRNHTHIGQPVTAIRNNGQWQFSPHHVFPNQGIGIIAVQTTLFDSSAVQGKGVYLDVVSSTFKPADGSVQSKQALGVRTSPYEITMEGMVSAASCGLTAPLTPATVYYMGTGANAGKLVTTANGNPVGFAVNQQDVYLSCATGFGSNINYTQENIGVNVGSDAIQPGLVPGTVVYLDVSSGRMWKAADPAVVQDQTNYNAHRPTGVLDSTMTRVIMFGTLNITSTTAWPLPLAVGSLYFCDTGVNAGKITAAGSITRWIVGTSIDTTRLFVNMFALASDQDHVATSPTHVKAATPAGVAQMISNAIKNLPQPPAIPGAIPPITFDGQNYGCITATYAVQGSGRSATLDEVNAGQSSDSFLYPWVTPQTLALWKPRVCSDGITIGGDGTPNNPLHTIVTGGGGGGQSGGSITIMPTTMPNGTVGVAYSLQLIASGGVAPYTWSVVEGALPAGLTLNASTGLISGTPLAAPSTGGTPTVIVHEVFLRDIIPCLRFRCRLLGHGFYIGQEFSISNATIQVTINGYSVTSAILNRGWVIEQILDADNFTFIISDFSLFGYYFGFPDYDRFRRHCIDHIQAVGFITITYTALGLHTGTSGGSTGTVTVQAHDSGSLTGRRVYPWKIVPNSTTGVGCHWDFDRDHDDRRHRGFCDHRHDIRMCPRGFRAVSFGTLDILYIRGCRILAVCHNIEGHFHVCIKGIGGRPPILGLFLSVQYTAESGSVITLRTDTSCQFSVNGDIGYWIWDASIAPLLPASGNGTIYFL